MLPDKLPQRPKFYNDDMTGEDWEYYYECRQKYDVPITLEENLKLVKEQLQMYDEGALDDAVLETMKAKHIALMPYTALGMRNNLGFKAIQEFNLYLAKQTLPGEFE